MRESNKALVSNGKQQCDEWLKAFWRVGYYSCYSQGRWDPQMFRMYVIFEEKCTYFNTFYHIITHFIFNLNIQNNCGWNPAKVLSSQSRIFTVLRTVGAGADLWFIIGRQPASVINPGCHTLWQATGYLSSFKVLPTFGRYQFILIGEQRHICERLV